MTLRRVREPAARRVYEAAVRWVDCCLRRDSSLFDEVRHTTTADNVDKLYAAFVDRPELGKERFLVKLKGQLADQPADVVQLAAELLYFHLLIALPHTMSGDRKREIVTTVLGFVAGTSPMPADLAAVLDSGLVNPGQAYLNYRYRQFAWLIEFLGQWKRLDPTQRDELLADAWRFGDWVYKLPEHSAFIQRYALLHLIFPDTYPPVVSRDHRERILQRCRRRSLTRQPAKTTSCTSSMSSWSASTAGATTCTGRRSCASGGHAASGGSNGRAGRSGWPRQ